MSTIASNDISNYSFQTEGASFSSVNAYPIVSSELINLEFSDSPQEGLREKAKRIHSLYLRWQPLLADVSVCVGCIAKMEVWAKISEYIIGPVEDHSSSKMSKFSVGAIASGIIALVGAVRSFHMSATAVDYSQRVDSALNGIVQISQAGDSVATSAFGAQAFGWLENVAVWAKPVAIVSAALAGVTIVRESLSLREGQKLLAELNQDADVESFGSLEADDYRPTRVLTNLLDKSNYCLNKHFCEDAVKLRRRIETVTTAATSIPSKENKERAVLTLDALKERLVSKNFSNKLNILAAVVALIGAALLLFTPFGTIALAVMALGYAVSIIKFIYEFRASRKFAAVMQL